MVGLEWVSQRMVCCHLVAIAAADLLVGEVPAILELTDDLLHRAHRDSDRMGDVSLSELGVAVDRDEDVGLIGEERPGWKVRFGFDQVHAQTVPTLSGGTVDPVGSVVPAGLLSHLACHPLEDGTWMPDHEVAGMVSQLLVAGHETTTSLITNAVWRLLEDRSRWERLVAEPTLVPNVLEESLRFDPPVLGLCKTNNRPITRHGVEIEQDSKVMVLYASANRDEATFDRPDVFVMDRPLLESKRHLSFGWGTHFCLGAHLARLTARVALAGLVDRLPDLRIDGDTERLEAPFLWGRRKLPVAWN